MVILKNMKDAENFLDVDNIIKYGNDVAKEILFAAHNIDSNALAESSIVILDEGETYPDTQKFTCEISQNHGEYNADLYITCDDGNGFWVIYPVKQKEETVENSL